jgi:F-type H+-transporting ATPase subunit gamma
MTDTVSSLRRKIASAGDLQSVVRTMKAVAASSIAQYENSVRSVVDYNRAIELGLSVCFRQLGNAGLASRAPSSLGSRVMGAVVIGTDLGLVGRFNDVVAEHAIETLKQLPGEPQVWVVGERVQHHLQDAGLSVLDCLPVPTSVSAITPLIGRVLLESETLFGPSEGGELYLFYNRPGVGGAYAAVSERLLPLDAVWVRKLTERRWPTNRLPEVVGGGTVTLRAAIREYLFVSLFRACAESLASENASRLAAMQRADKNIGEMLEELNGRYHQLRQTGIDEELFDVVSGFEALKEGDE